MNNIYKIHFVSYGHAFRSRLAEAYLKYVLRKKPHYMVSSSGIRVETDINGPIAWYAMKILSQHELIPYMSLGLAKTSDALLEENDLVVFMDYLSYEYCKKRFGKLDNFEIWNLEYIPSEEAVAVKRESSALEVIRQSERIFDQIQGHCHQLIDELNVSKSPFHA